MRRVLVVPTAWRVAGSRGTATPMGLDEGDLDVTALFRIRIEPPGDFTTLEPIVEPSSCRST